MEPQPSDAEEVLLAQCRTHDDVREKHEGASGEAAEHCHAGDRRVGSDVSVELSAETSELLVHLDGRSVAAALVEHVGADGSETVFPSRIGRCAATDEEQERHNWHLRVADGPHAEPVWKRRLVDGRERERSGGTGLGQPIARGAHETTAGVEWAAASVPRPCGTMLSVTRRVGSRYRPTA